MDELSVILRAKQFVGNVTAAPVDVLALARSLNVEVKESDQLDSDEAGRTFKRGGQIFVVVNQNDDPYRQRFTILHELAHHVLELPSRHGEKLASTELERFGGRPFEEKLCDAFAAACLVPVHLIRGLSGEREFTADTIRDLSDLFQASKPCVASSFVRASPLPLAYVLAESGRIQNVITSAALRDLRIFVNHVTLPKTSAAAKALRNNSATEIADLDASDWSTSDAAECCVVHEEAICSRRWNQTLSLLSFEQIEGGGTQGASASEEDELLPELTGILPWPRK